MNFFVNFIPALALSFIVSLNFYTAVPLQGNKVNCDKEYSQEVKLNEI